MRNRPLLSVCLIILCVLASCTLVGKERFIKELRPSPLEICTTEDESVIVCGVIYRQEQKENGQMIYLKHNSVYSISNKQKFQESKIIVYINSREKLHIGNRIKVRQGLPGCGYSFLPPRLPDKYRSQWSRRQ